MSAFFKGVVTDSLRVGKLAINKNGSVSGAEAPTGPNDLVTKSYVDSKAGGSSKFTRADIIVSDTAKMVGSTYDGHSIVSWTTASGDIVDSGTQYIGMRIVVGVNAETMPEGTDEYNLATTGIYEITSIDPLILTRAPDARYGGEATGITISIDTDNSCLYRTNPVFLGHLPEPMYSKWGENIFFSKIGGDTYEIEKLTATPFFEQSMLFTGHDNDFAGIDGYIFCKTIRDSVAREVLSLGTMTDGVSVTFGALTEYSPEIIRDGGRFIMQNGEANRVTLNRDDNSAVIKTSSSFVELRDASVKLDGQVFSNTSVFQAISVSNTSTIGVVYVPSQLVRGTLYREASVGPVTDTLPVASEFRSYINACAVYESTFEFTIVNKGTNNISVVGGSDTPIRPTATVVITPGMCKKFLVEIDQLNVNVYTF